MVVRALAPLVALLLLAGCTASSTGSPSPTPVASTPDPDPGIPSASPLPAPTASPLPYVLQPLGTFSAPEWVGPVPGDADSLFLVERTGKIRHLDTTGHSLGVVLDLTDQTSHGNEQGVLGMAFDPDYTKNHRIYVDFTDRGGDTKVVAYTVTDGVAGAGQELLGVDQPFPNHNGGTVLFDSTGMLLIGLGDGGSAGDPGDRAQDLTTPLGKILRIDPRTGAGAPDNPFPKSPKTWALGLRNPLRFTFDTNGDLYLGDVGQNKVEELDVVPPRFQRGANYGWSVFEGNDRFKEDRQIVQPGPLIAPALTYAHIDGACSLTGGEVYHGTALPALQGKYVFGDYCEGDVLVVTRTPTGVTPSEKIGVKVGGLSGIFHDAQHELLVLSATALFRILPVPTTAPTS